MDSIFPGVEVLDGGMNYGWMLVSLVFGVFNTFFVAGGGSLRWLRWASIPKHPVLYAIFVLCRQLGCSRGEISPGWQN